MMTKTFRLLGILSCVLLGVFATQARAAEEQNYGVPAGTIVVPEGLSSDEVQRSILEAAAGRGWMIKSHDGEKVVVYLEQEKWVANITLTYTAKDVQLFSKSTKSGKPKLPETWIKFLKQDINIKLNTLMISKKK